MLRSRILFTFSCVLASLVLVGSGCKKGEEKEAKPTEAKPVQPEAPPTPVEEPPVEGDLTLIDKSLEALADATVAKGGGLPPFKGEHGIACGDEEVLGAALAHIGFDAATLKEGVGYRFSDVCLGWRPYVEPVTEMFWMISAGAPNPENGIMPHRRCLRVRTADGTNTKDAIMDGPCLELDRKARANAMAAEAEEKKKAGDDPADGADAKAAADKAEADKPAPDKGAKDKAAPAPSK